MNAKDFIPVLQLCTEYKVKTSFIEKLNEVGLIEIMIIEKKSYLHQDKIIALEKMIRIHQELSVNIEGIDVVFNLLQKVDELQNDLIIAKNRLMLYENE